MSEAQRCRDKNLDRDVVVKALKPGINPKRIIEEAKALSQIRSKHVVQIFDVIRDSSGTIIGIVEEYLDGPDLVPAATNDNLDAVLLTLFQISSGIEQIHASGVIHRDLKPDNMKYSTAGQLKLFDFGLAKGVGQGGTTSLYYTPGFACPEYFQKKNGLHDFSFEGDVFAFGAIAIWYLGNGQVPKALQSIPPAVPLSSPFAHALVSLPPNLVSLLAKTLEPDPSDRPTMSEVRMAIEAEILRGRHRLLLTTPSQEFEVNGAKPQNTIRWKNCSVRIKYDGLKFIVEDVKGNVTINNMRLAPGYELSGAAVLVMSGDSGRSSDRISLTADVSHPEVIV
ncbi:MAG: serine/threonine-protein kinase [Erythrobacter sp.]|uniref:serine/threonine-protein kinase n=1 Tax=Erythrobacter sp. TaxID=1042 RepID=UPI00329A6D90